MAASNIKPFVVLCHITHAVIFELFLPVASLAPLFLSLEFTCAACEKFPRSPLRSKPADT